MNSEDLIQIGAYKKGTSREVDEAINYYPEIISYLEAGGIRTGFFPGV